LLMLLKDMHESILYIFGCSEKFAFGCGFWSWYEANLYILELLTSRLIVGVMNLFSELKLGVMFGLKGVIFGICVGGFMNGVYI